VEDSNEENSNWFDFDGRIDFLLKKGSGTERAFSRKGWKCHDNTV
jgi:hypothetical protein